MIRSTLARAPLARHFGAVAALSLCCAASAVAAPPSPAAYIDDATVSPPAAAKQFGFALAMDGDFVVIGAPAQAPGGEAYVFVREDDEWVLDGTLLPSDGGAADRFGSTVAIAGDTIVVGAPLHDTPIANVGAAYVFRRGAGGWSQEARLAPTAGVLEEQFAWDVGLSGDTAVVGAYNAPAGAIAGAGATYVFVRTGTTWALQQRVVADDPSTNARFGSGVAIDGDTLIAGARGVTVTAASQGAAYAFVRTGATWTQQAKLVAADGALNDNLGNNVAVSRDTALLGALGANAGYVFERAGTTWTMRQKLVAAGSGQLGVGVALAGDFAVLGAPATASSAGAVHVFARQSGEWAPYGSALASAATGAAAGDEFGRAVGIAGTSIAVGVPVPAAPTGRVEMFIDIAGPDAVFANGFEDATPAR